jgi:hypothetical protein
VSCLRCSQTISPPHELFGPAERAVVGDARVLVHAPRTVNDLIRRRIRVMTGVGQVERSADAPASSQRTSRRDLVAILKDRPALAPRIAVFLVVTFVARVRVIARRE